MAASSRSESVAGCLEPGFPGGFQRVLDHRLEAAVANGWDAEWTERAAGFRYVHPFGGFGSPRLDRAEVVHQLPSGRGGFYQDLVHPRGPFALIHLRYSPYGHESVGVASQH